MDPISNKAIIGHIPAFLELWAKRPIKNNFGGCSSVHALYLYVTIKELGIRYVVESGVWKGQTSWLIEQLIGGSNMVRIEPRSDIVEYNPQGSMDAIGPDFEDFGSIDFPDKNADEWLVFVDDHVDAYTRLLQCKNKGFKHVLFDDNYPAVVEGKSSAKTIKERNERKPKKYYYSQPVGLNASDELIRKDIEKFGSHMEFPPIYSVMSEKTRWNDAYGLYPTLEGLFTIPGHNKADSRHDLGIQYHQLFADRKDYTWPVYFEIR